MAVVNTDIRPPYVRFEQRAVEDRSQEISKGKYGFRNVDIVKITVPGQKDIVERYAEDWLADLQVQAENGRIPSEWPDKFADAYARWKKGQEMPLDGTPIRGWNVLSPAIQETLILHGILTVEDLAAISDEAVRAIGTGAITFKQKAAAWVRESTSVGSVAAENASLKRDQESMSALIAAQAEQLSQMRAQLDVLTGAKAAPPSSF